MDRFRFGRGKVNSFSMHNEPKEFSKTDKEGASRGSFVNYTTYISKRPSSNHQHGDKHLWTLQNIINVIFKANMKHIVENDNHSLLMSSTHT